MAGKVDLTRDERALLTVSRLAESPKCTKLLHAAILSIMPSMRW
jgi:hypothetical protein